MDRLDGALDVHRRSEQAPGAGDMGAIPRPIDPCTDGLNPSGRDR